MFRVQDHRALELHRHTDGPREVCLQTNFQGRRRSSISRTNGDTPPLGAQEVGEGKVPTLQQSKH